MYPSHLIGKILQQLLLSNNFLYWQLLSSITFSRPVTPFSMYLRDFSCVCTIYILMYTYFSPKNVGIIAYLVHFWLKLYCIMYLVLPSTYVHENLPRRRWKYTIFLSPIPPQPHQHPLSDPGTYVYSKWTLQ